MPKVHSSSRNSEIQSVIMFKILFAVVCLLVCLCSAFACHLWLSRHILLEAFITEADHSNTSMFATSFHNWFSVMLSITELPLMQSLAFVNTNHYWFHQNILIASHSTSPGFHPSTNSQSKAITGMRVTQVTQCQHRDRKLCRKVFNFWCKIHCQKFRELSARRRDVAPAIFDKYF